LKSWGFKVKKMVQGGREVRAGFLATGEAELDFDVTDDVAQVCAAPRAEAEFSSREFASQATRTLIVEGWRFLAHSYAMVNQWQLLALCRRGDIGLSVIDAPLYDRRWQTQQGLFEPPAERILRSLPTAPRDAASNVRLRISVPFDFSPSCARLTAVFATCENQLMRREQFADIAAYEEFRRTPLPTQVKVVTPSRWSAEGFYKYGFTPEQVIIVPHGVDIDTFHPMPALRTVTRRSLALVDDAFVFLSIGAMTGNKGIDVLMKAFAQVSRSFPHARLVLKGMDPLYKSKDLLRRSLQTLSTQDQQQVSDRTTYLGRSFSNRKLAQFYQIADAYVSPYRAEGFNIPVLEAAACGIPVICTGGGPTDDFVADGFARKIASEKMSGRIDDQDMVRLEPSVEHLIDLMRTAIEDQAWRAQAAAAGPAHVGANFTWERAVAALVQKLFD